MLFFLLRIWWLFRLLFIVCLFIPNMMLLIKLEWSRLWFKIIKIPSASHSLEILGKCIFSTCRYSLFVMCWVRITHFGANLITLFSENLNISQPDKIKACEMCSRAWKDAGIIQNCCPMWYYFSSSSSLYFAVQAIYKAIALVFISFFSVFYHHWC